MVSSNEKGSSWPRQMKQLSWEVFVSVCREVTGCCSDAHIMGVHDWNYCKRLNPGRDQQTLVTHSLFDSGWSGPTRDWMFCLVVFLFIVWSSYSWMTNETLKTLFLVSLVLILLLSVLCCVVLSVLCCAPWITYLSATTLGFCRCNL